MGCLLLAGMALGGPDCEAAQLTLRWTNNILTVSGPEVPGGKMDIWYLEAFCRPGSTRRDWAQTVIPHHTELISLDEERQALTLRSRVEPAVEVVHEIRAGVDDVDIRVSLRNTSANHSEIDWFQPCLRVDRFTGRGQSNYVSRCFIYTERGLTMLDQTRRTEDAIYRGGQVYVPAGVNLNDVNPRPISSDRPVNGLIGCFSEDNRWLLATAWDHTQELFQGVIVCIHSDPRVGGLGPGETKVLHGKLYLMKNDSAELLARYRRDFARR